MLNQFFNILILSFIFSIIHLFKLLDFRFRPFVLTYQELDAVMKVEVLVQVFGFVHQILYFFAAFELEAPDVNWFQEYEKCHVTKIDYNECNEMCFHELIR